MRKTRFLKYATIAMLLAGSLSAGTFVTDPTSGLIFGSPGTDTGWGFTATNDDFVQSISFSQSVLINETNPLLGTYTDLIGPQGGPDNFALDPTATWSQTFDELNLTGLGFYSIAPGAIPGSSNSGLIRVFYNFADGTPDSIDVPFTVSVEAAQTATPEPGTWGLLLAGSALILTRRRRA